MPRITRKTVNKQKKSLKPSAKPKSSPATEAPQETQEGNPIYFWKPHEVPYGIFSQWLEEDFKVPNDDGTETTFGTAEQYMMYRKAVLFGDLAVAAEILTTTNPRTQKALGRTVKNFDEKIWCENRSLIVEEGNYWKFKTDPKPLLDTGDRELIEASPRDRLWGIGYGPAKANVKDRHKWGMNLLGKALMETRRRISEETGVAAEEDKGNVGGGTGGDKESDQEV